MIFLSCVLFCCTQVLTPDNKWLKVDEEHLLTAKNRCHEIYPNSPCLVKFQKMEERVYRATCGKENNR